MFDQICSDSIRLIIKFAAQSDMPMVLVCRSWNSAIKEIRLKNSARDVQNHIWPFYEMPRHDWLQKMIIGKVSKPALACAIVASGNLDMIRHYYLDLPQEIDILLVAIRHGHIHVLNWAQKMGFYYQHDKRIMRAAIKSNRLDVIKWLHERRYTININIGNLSNARTKSSEGVAQYLLANGYPIGRAERVAVRMDVPTLIADWGAFSKSAQIE